MPSARYPQTIVTRGLRRVVIGEPISAAKTYEEWLAHITERTSFVWSWASSPSNISEEGRVGRTTAAAFTGVMVGSSWGDGGFATSFNAATTSRIVQHALPTGDLTGATPGQQVLLVLQRVPNRDYFPEVTRNGFTSTPNSVPPMMKSAAICTQCAWWSPSLGAPMMNNPFQRTAPVPYAAPGW